MSRPAVPPNILDGLVVVLFLVFFFILSRHQSGNVQGIVPLAFPRTWPRFPDAVPLAVLGRRLCHSPLLVVVPLPHPTTAKPCIINYAVGTPPFSFFDKRRSVQGCVFFLDDAAG